MQAMRRLVGCLFLCLAIVVIAEDDLYKILGVSKKATTKEIKQAYRRKALDTHPDKNKGVPPEEAAEAFHKVVHAFEVLSDETSRKHYDRTGDSSGSQKKQQHQQQYGHPFNMFFQRRQYPVKMKDKFEVKQAQSRVMHIVSLEQLKTVMLDDNDLLERNILICFVTPQVEATADDEVLFPYPFAAMSTQGIWWEDLLQTVKVRFHRRNELTDFFGVSNDMQMPQFLFGKRGTPLSPDMVRMETHRRQTFDSWVWKQLEVRVHFVNRHSHPVEIYWLHKTRATLSTVLQPNEQSSHNTMLSHEFYARDARVDTRSDSPGRHKLTPNSSLGTYKILSDEQGQEIIIEAKTCFDLSGHCLFWHRQNECNKNPLFMAHECRKTCNLCTDQDDKKASDHSEL